jgi:hypothetical protein
VTDPVSPAVSDDLVATVGDVMEGCIEPEDAALIVAALHPLIEAEARADERRTIAAKVSALPRVRPINGVTWDAVLVDGVLDMLRGEQP